MIRQNALKCCGFASNNSNLPTTHTKKKQIHLSEMVFRQDNINCLQLMYIFCKLIILICTHYTKTNVINKESIMAD